MSKQLPNGWNIRQRTAGRWEPNGINSRTVTFNSNWSERLIHKEMMKELRNFGYRGREWIGTPFKTPNREPCPLGVIESVSRVSSAPQGNSA